MILLRAWCCAAMLPLIAIGCKNPPMPLLGQRWLPVKDARPQAARVAVPPTYVTQPSTNSSEPHPAIEARLPVTRRSPAFAVIDYQEPLPQPDASSAVEGIPSSELEIVGDVLSREWLVAEIEARNPSLAAMVAAWRAQAQRYPQVVALDDPMLMAAIGPDSIDSDLVDTGYMLELKQRLPWFGKRTLRGEVADAEAEAALEEAQDSRLQVRLAADLAFFEYFLAARLIELNRQNAQILEQFRQTAQTRYRTGLGRQEDVLQADVEVADLARRQLELERMQLVATARINTLLRRWPDAPLPSPPAELEPPREPAEPSLLWQTALQQRPDLAMLAWRVQAEEASLELAYKNYYPDFDVFARYDAFWQERERDLRTQIGAAMNLPIYRQKLHAAVCEAQFRLAQRRAEFDQRALEIQYEVVSAAQQLEESRKAVELYEQRLVPAVEQNVSTIRANYENNRTTFLEFAQAQRQLVTIRERQIEAIVAYQRRLAELDRVVGVPSPSSAN